MKAVNNSGKDTGFMKQSVKTLAKMLKDEIGPKSSAN